jgi:hypothetical protein
MKSEIESPPTLPVATSKPKKRKSGPEPPSLSHEERFFSIFKSALPGLCAQFEQNNRYDSGKAELDRCQQIVRRAWNLAVYGTAMFEDDERAIQKFNDTVKKVEAK